MLPWRNSRAPVCPRDPSTITAASILVRDRNDAVPRRRRERCSCLGVEAGGSGVIGSRSCAAQRLARIQILERSSRHDGRDDGEALGRRQLRADVEDDGAPWAEQFRRGVDRMLGLVGAVVADENRCVAHCGLLVGFRIDSRESRSSGATTAGTDQPSSPTGALRATTTRRAGARRRSAGATRGSRRCGRAAS